MQKNRTIKAEVFRCKCQCCGYSRVLREHLFGEVFAATCDPLDGKRIEAMDDYDYACPHCGSKEVCHWGYWTPRYERVRLPVVTHKAWLARDRVQQDKRIIAALMKAVEHELPWRHN